MALAEGEGTATVGIGDTAWLAGVLDEEQALPMAPMTISTTIARQPQPAACCFFCDTGFPHSSPRCYMTRIRP